MSFNSKGSPFLKIVYAQVKVDGKLELIPMELYEDGSLRRSQ
jgi:hypothetical protein